MILYNSIGGGYNNTRQPDRRITEKIVNLLDLSPGKTIADIGAGTGNYSNAIADRGYRIIAIEPALVMEQQAITHHQVKWITASAEQIPLADNSVDAAIAMLALHHFSNLNLAIKEISRIVGKETIVIFAFEQHKIKDFWLSNYFPYFVRDTLKTFPSTEVIANKIRQITKKNVEIIPFLLPPDLTDMFAASGWCQPEIYLDSNVRKNISSFVKMPAKELETGIARLSKDVKNGDWNRKYGELKQLKTYDAGYRILVAKTEVKNY